MTSPTPSDSGRDDPILHVTLPAPSAEGPLDGVALIVLSRPEVLNALDFALIAALTDALEALDRDPACRVMVITGAGDRAFAAGADIPELAAQSPTTLTIDDDFHRWERIKRVRKPLVAAVRGFALGGGCELAMACDLIVAGEDAQFGQPEIKLGLMPGAGGTQRLTRLVGLQKAKEIVYGGSFYSASACLELGLVDKVFGADEVYDAAVEAARRYAQGAFALRFAKQAINDGIELDLDAALRLETTLFSACFATADRKQGMDSFLEHGPGRAQFTQR